MTLDFTFISGPVRLSSKFQVSAVLDKGSGALIVVDVITKDVATNQNILRNQLSIFVVVYLSKIKILCP